MGTRLGFKHLPPSLGTVGWRRLVGRFSNFLRGWGECTANKICKQQGLHQGQMGGGRSRGSLIENIRVG